MTIFMGEFNRGGGGGTVQVVSESHEWIKPFGPNHEYIIYKSEPDHWFLFPVIKGFSFKSADLRIWGCTCFLNLEKMVPIKTNVHRM